MQKEYTIRYNKFGPAVEFDVTIVPTLGLDSRYRQVYFSGIKYPDSEFRFRMTDLRVCPSVHTSCADFHMYRIKAQETSTEKVQELEDKLFQISLVWDYCIDLHTVLEIQKSFYENLGSVHEKLFDAGEQYVYQKLTVFY